MKRIFKKEARVIGIAGFIFALLVFMFVSNASAYSPAELSYSVRQGIQYATAFYQPILEVVIGDYTSSDFFFIKVMLLILTFVVVRAVLDKVPAFKDNKAVVFIISAVISILSVRYMTDIQIVKGVLMSYETLGVALTTVIPFIVWFFFVEKSIDTSIGRRALWIFFLIIFTIVWYERYSNLGSFANYLYAGIIIMSLLAILLDRRVRVYFSMHELKRAERSINDQIILDLLKQYKDARSSGTEWGNRRAKEIKNHLKELGVSV